MLPACFLPFSLPSSILPPLLLYFSLLPTSVSLPSSPSTFPTTSPPLSSPFPSCCCSLSCSHHCYNDCFGKYILHARSNNLIFCQTQHNDHAASQLQEFRSGRDTVSAGYSHFTHILSFTLPASPSSTCHYLALHPQQLCVFVPQIQD